MATADLVPTDGYVAGINDPQTSLIPANNPGVLSDWQSFNTLTAEEITNLGNDDANGVVCEEYWYYPNEYYSGGVCGRIELEVGTTSQLDLTCVAYDGYGYQTFAFYIWDNNGSDFELVDTNTPEAPGTAHTLSGTISSNLSNYIDGSNYVWLLLIPTSYSASNAKVASYMTLTQTYTPSGGGGSTARVFIID